MTTPVLHGPAYSNYVRTARLTLLEKGVEHTLDAFDIFQGIPPEQSRRHPFNKVPALTHGTITLYETVAICRYVDEAFDGPSLQPQSAIDRARVTQICAVLDNYAFAPAFGVIIWQRLVSPMRGEKPDEGLIAIALPKAKKAISVLDAFIDERANLVGDQLSLADLHLIPNYAYFLMTPEGVTLTQDTPGLKRWWAAMRERESVKSTEPEIL